MVLRDTYSTVNRLTTLVVLLSLVVSGTTGALALGGGHATPTATAADGVETGQSADASLTAQTQSNGTVCAHSTGDPHIRTFDGASYDFQKAGEFILAKSPQFTAQVRQEMLGNSDVAVNTAFALSFAGGNVTVNTSNGLTLKIDGTKKAIKDAIYPVGNGTVTVDKQGSLIIITLPGPDGEPGNGDTRFVIDDRGNLLDISVCVNTDHSGPVRGLLGSPDGDRSNDIKVRNGTTLGRPVDADLLYGRFADSWNVSKNVSLFDYAPGAGPWTYYEENSPNEVVKVSDFPQEEVDAARAEAEAAGLEPGTVNFRNAVLDYLVTGNEVFFESAKVAPEISDENLVEITKFDEEEPVVSGSMTADHTALEAPVAE
jgi:hypothetical protein